MDILELMHFNKKGILMIKRILYCIVLFMVSQSSAATISNEECVNKGDEYIFAGDECIQYVISEGDKDGSLNIIVHGTWDEGTNTLGRYAPFAETLSMSTDITSIAVALPGYSNSSTNNFTALSHKGIENLAAQKKYLDFMEELITALKTKYKATTVNYIGHSAGAMMGATLTGYKPSLINNLVSIGGRYDIHEVTKNKTLISIVDVMDGIDKDIKYLLIYGSQDKISKPEVTKKFYKKALKKGLNVKLVEVKEGVHLDLDMTDTSVEAITELLDY